MFVLGGSGFIGQEVVRQARAGGLDVHALGRSEASQARLRELEATPVAGDAQDPQAWIDAARGSAVIVDLLQPKFPRRLTVGAAQAISAERQAFTRGLLGALGTLPAGERPVLFSISGADDLQPDADGRIHAASPLRSVPVAFSHVGVPVRRLVEQSSLDATFVYLGAIVYGPGKVFEDVIVDGLRKRRARVIGNGSNRLPLVHVDDAAGALVHLAGLPREQIAGKAFLATDGSATTQRELLDITAEGMGRKRPGSVPAFVAGLIAGRAGVESITLDAVDDPAALHATGFAHRYPSAREGVPPTLEALGVKA